MAFEVVEHRVAVWCTESFHTHCPHYRLKVLLTLDFDILESHTHRGNGGSKFFASFLYEKKRTSPQGN